MLSVYSGMDMNFTQSFPTPSFGLARSRVATFEPQEAFRQQQQQHQPPPPPYPTTDLCSSVSLVEPMLQSNMLVTPVSSITTPTSSLSPSTSLMYYDSYSSPFLPNNPVDSSGTANVSVSSSPSLNDSWGYTLPIDVLPESTYNHTFTTSCESQSQAQQPFMFSPNIPSYHPLPPPSQHQHSQEHEEQLLYPLSSGVQACDPLPNFLSLQGYPYQQNGRNMHQVYDGLPPSQTPVVTSAIIMSPISPSTSTSSPRSNKRKRTQSPSMSPSSCSSATKQHQQHRQSKHPRHHHARNVDSSRPMLSSTGSLSPLSEQRYTTTSGSIPYSSMNMVSSFPTKVNVSSNASSKRYECHICSKKFTRPSSLTTHIYSHTKEKPFQCPVEGCGRHFSVVSNLRRHAKIHSSPSNSKY